MNLSASTTKQKMDPAATGLSGRHGDPRVLDCARLTVYRFLSLATSNPQSERWPRILDAGFQELFRAAVELIRNDPQACPQRLARGEISLEGLDPAALMGFLANPKDDFCQAYDRVFGLLVSRECPPYETEYCPQTFSVYRSQHLADIAGFYRAFGLEPSRKSPQRHDHIALELEFMAWLNTKTLYALEQGDAENADLCRDAQVRFFKEHLAWWITAFALALRKKADGIRDERDLALPPRSLQGAIGAFLSAFIPAERGILGIALPTTLIAVKVGNTKESDAEDCETCALGVDTTFE